MVPNSAPSSGTVCSPSQVHLEHTDIRDNYTHDSSSQGMNTSGSPSSEALPYNPARQLKRTIKTRKVHDRPDPIKISMRTTPMAHHEVVGHMSTTSDTEPSLPKPQLTVQIDPTSSYAPCVSVGSGPGRLQLVNKRVNGFTNQTERRTAWKEYPQACCLCLTAPEAVTKGFPATAGS